VIDFKVVNRINPAKITTICTYSSPGSYIITSINSSSLFPGSHNSFDPFLFRTHLNSVPFFAGYPLYYHGDGAHGLSFTQPAPDTYGIISGTLTPGKHEFSLLYDNEC